MAFDNYDQLKEQIASFLWDRDDAATQIPAFIELAESEMRRLLRTQQTTAVKRFVMSAGLSSLPCGAGQVKGVNVDGLALTYLSPEHFSDAAHDVSSGVRPRFYTVRDGSIYFWPHNSAGKEGEIVYVDPFEPLSDSCDCNWILKRHPDIYLSGALRWAKRWLIDPAQDWDTVFFSAIEAANKDNPRVQPNTKIRADDVSMMAGRRGFNIYTGGF